MPSLVGQMLGVISDSGVSRDEQSARLARATTTLAVIFVLGGIATSIRGFLFNLAGERVVARLRAMLFTHLIAQDISFFDRNTTGELMNRLASDTTVLQSAVTINISMGMRFVAQALIGILLILLYSW